MTWTPDQITTLVVDVGGVIAGITTLVKVLHTNRMLSEKATSSVPNDVAHRLIDSTQDSNSKETTLQTNPPNGPIITQKEGVGAMKAEENFSSNN